jgi:IS1 family transposase
MDYDCLGGATMELRLRPIYQERASDPNTLGVIVIEKIDTVSPITDNFDMVLLIITKENDIPVFTKHYSFENNKKAAMHTITEKQLQKWLVVGYNKKIVDWLFYGKVLFDRNEYVETLKKNLKDNPFEGRQVKLGVEFAKLIRRYQESKVSFDARDYFDAYNHMVETLNHLARQAVIQHGRYPEVTVWNQLKSYNVDIYNLYERFITSHKDIKARLVDIFDQVALLIEQSIEESAAHLLEVMRAQPHWSVQQLHENEALKIYSVNLEFFVEFLREKGYIVIERIETKSPEVYHRYYAVKK